MHGMLRKNRAANTMRPLCEINFNQHWRVTHAEVAPQERGHNVDDVRATHSCTEMVSSIVC